MSQILLKLYRLLLLIYLQTDLIKKTRPMQLANLCDTIIPRIIDMNSILGISSNASNVILEPITVFRDNKLALWSPPFQLITYMNNTRFKQLMSTATIRDIKHMLRFLDMEFFVELDPREISIGRVCGTNFLKDRVYSEPLESTDYEMCTSLYNFIPFSPSKLIKLRFSQPSKSHFSIYEYYEDRIVVSGIPRSSIGFLNSIEFLANRSSGYQNLMYFVLRTCYDTDDIVSMEPRHQQDNWTRYTTYHTNEVYHEAGNLCNSIHAIQGRYNLFRQSATYNSTYILKDIRIHQTFATDVHSINVQLIGDFTKRIDGDTLTLQLIQPLFTYLSNYFNVTIFTPRAAQFSLSKVVVTDKNCNLQLIHIKNFTTRIEPIQYQRFILTQSVNGVKIIILRTTFNIELKYPNYFLEYVNCGLNETNDENLLILSTNPQLIIDGTLKSCSSNLL